MARNLVCSECGGNLQEGVLFDQGYLGIRTRPYWLEGKPEWSSWDGWRIKGTKKYLIAAYRCENCGLMKFYADSEEPSKKSK